MMTLSTQAPGSVHADRQASTIWRPAWLLAREVLITRGTLGLIVGAAGLGLLSRALRPLGISVSKMHVEELDGELRRLLFGCLALLLLVRAAHWRRLLDGLGPASMASIAILSCVYLHFICFSVFALAGWLLVGDLPALGWTPGGESLWLSSLVGILALARLEARTLGLVFLFLAGCVPILGMTDPGVLLPSTKGIPQPAWSADGILPMLVPHLLALGYVCLERAQR